MIRVDSVSCGYTAAAVLQHLSLDIGDTEFTVIIGPNGAGKSTLLYAVMGLLPLRSGNVEIDGIDLAEMRRQDLAKLVAFVPQEVQTQFDYPVREMILMGRYPWLSMLQSWSEEDHAVAYAVMRLLKLQDLAERYFNHLSGGEKQRVLIARALAQETKYIFLDETISQLDINHQIEIMQLLDEINRLQGKGIVLVSHNLNLAANFASRLVFIRHGQVLGSGTPAEMITPQRLYELMGIELMTMHNPLSNTANILYPGRTSVIPATDRDETSSAQASDQDRTSGTRATDQRS
ncbi:MAG: ABC transporter ATP-binding protein [Candidatus Cloacimonetes bacterium]|nr:ABC transporter ATP-binding protein [Candidatus Cloacimonadota bacterium]